MLSPLKNKSGFDTKLLGHTIVVWGETQEHGDKEGEKLSFVKSFNP